MIDLYKAIENSKFDSRLVERNLNNGSISKAEYEAYQKSLKDLKDNTLQVSLESDDNLSEEYN